MNSDSRRNNLPRNLSVSEILSCFPAFLIHFRWCLPRRLFPSQDRAPLAWWESAPLRSILPACIQVEAAVGQVLLRGLRIPLEIFRRNSVSATRKLRRRRRSYGQQ